MRERRLAWRARHNLHKPMCKTVRLPQTRRGIQATCGRKEPVLYLSHVTSPADVKALPASALPTLCEELRSAIIESSAVAGGHVGPNLGIIELTVALHRVFDSPTDKFVFDVSHQTYAHKALTGRASAFLDPARYGTLSGFSNPAESEHDLFAMGHTSTSLSLACGLAKARDLAHETHNVVAVIGDGSLSGGLAFEGLNNLSELRGGVIVIINDNGWSIAPDQGGISRHLAELRASRGTCPNNLFRALGLGYSYLEDGNDVCTLVSALTELRGTTSPQVLHIHTTKGLGFAPAEKDPEAWHHVGPFDAVTGEKRSHAADSHKDTTAPEDYAQITGDFLSARMATDPRLVVVNAATPYIMGFSPERRAQAGAQFVDVGIAEEHAVTYVTALAKAGAHPVLGLYGTFLQRSYDELWHDLALNAAPATILVFGSSAHGTTDATHLGYFDITMLADMPGLTYLAPTCKEEYLAMLSWSVSQTHGPVAVRVPGADVVSRPSVELPEDFGPACEPEIVRQGADVAILALGDIFPLGEQVAERLSARGINATLVNPRLATAPNEDLLNGLADAGHRLVVTLEDGVRDGGFGERCARVLAERGDVRVRCYGLPLAFCDRYEPEELLASCGMSVDGLVADIEHDLADTADTRSGR